MASSSPQKVFNFFRSPLISPFIRGQEEERCILAAISMFSQDKEIGTDHIVIFWFTRESCKAVKITPGEELNGRYGVYRHSDLIGKPYGSKVGSRNGKGFVYVLRPTPELWTLALPHRTQILYVADIAFITSWLGIKPGSIVVEAGTGSGSFSHSVARTIGPGGRLHSFEFHETRHKAAQAEFAEHGMSEYVSIKHVNVCKAGFDLHDVADAVFLDLPAPWEAIPFAKESLKKTRATRICCFSPCMEQVLRTTTALNEAGFAQITMYETLLRAMDVNSYPPPKSIKEVQGKLREAEVKKEERRLRQMASAKLRMTGEGSTVQKGKRKAADDDDEDEEEDGVPNKRVRELSVLPGTPKKPQDDTRPSMPSKPSETRTPLSKPFAEQRGHTSYLTFAVLLPTIFPGSGTSIPSTLAVEEVQNTS